MARGRAANGSGLQPRKRADGVCEVRYTAGIRADGRTIRRSLYGKSSEEVAEKLRAVTASIDAHTYIEPHKMTVEAWLKIWLADYTMAIKDSTRSIYGDNVRLHIVPALGRVKLGELMPHDVQMFANRLLRGGRGAQPLAVKTVRNIVGTLSKALSEAVRLRYMAANPAAGVILPRIHGADICPLEVEEIGRFNDALPGTPGQDLLWFLLNTGCRLSEALGLRWSRVNFQRGTITIDAQMLVSRKGQGRALGTPKNGRARTFKPAPRVMECLKGVQRRQKEWQLKAGPAWSNLSGLVFTNEIGEGLPHNTVENWFRKTARLAGVEGHRLHDLRHTFATEALRAGVDVKSISETLGHSSVAFTLDVYAGFTEAMQDEAAARIQALLEDRDGKQKSGPAR